MLLMTLNLFFNILQSYMLPSPQLAYFIGIRRIPTSKSRFRVHLHCELHPNNLGRFRNIAPDYLVRLLSRWR